MEQTASFADIVAAIGSDIKSLFTGEPLAGAPLQDQIDAKVNALHIANQTGNTAEARLILQDIKDIQAKAAGMINPLVGRASVVENVDNAIAGVSKPFAAVNAWVGANTTKLLLVGVGLVFVYGYAKGR